MVNSTNSGLEPIRIEEDGSPKLIAGLSRTYSFGTPLNGAAQWEQFSPYIGMLSAQKGATAYGVCFELADAEGLEYVCGVEVTEDAELPKELTAKELPAQRYAVFLHEGHVSAMRKTLDAISEWLPESEFDRPEEVNFFFERYGERFNPETGAGEIEIWIPIE